MFDTNRSINWREIIEDFPMELPLGSSLDFTITFDEEEFLTGKNGIVWGTIDPRQAEIIQNALSAMQISSEIKIMSCENQKMFLIEVANDEDKEDAIDFIWRSISGLHLRPDWSYPAGEANKSFELWLSGQ